MGEYDRATPLCEKGLALSRELGDKRCAAHFLIHFGIVAMNQSYYAQATRLHQEALTLGRELQDTWWIWLGLSHLAEVSLREGNYAQAAAYYSESLAVARETGDKHFIAMTLRYWGEVESPQRISPGFFSGLSPFRAAWRNPSFSRCRYSTSTTGVG